MLHYKLLADKEKPLVASPGNLTLVTSVTAASHASADCDFCNGPKETTTQGSAGQT